MLASLNSRAVRRSVMLRFAILSSAISKALGLLLQVVAIPLVYRTLGPHDYALYILLSALLGTITLVQMGAGPGLTQKLASAYANGSREQEGSLFNAALRVITVAAVIGGAVILAVVHLTPPSVLFGESFMGDRSVVVSVTDGCVVLCIAQLVSTVGDSALAGYQEQVLSNLGSAAANIIALMLLVYICHHETTVLEVIVVVYGVPAFCRLVNMVALIIRRPYLATPIFRSCKGSYQPLINVGVAFWVIELATALEQQGGNFLLAHLSSPQQTDLFAIVFRNICLAGAVVSMITQPLWPAMADAIAHHDVSWILRAYTRIRRLLTVYSVSIAVLTILAGPWALKHFVHMEPEANRFVFVFLAAYFVVNIWTHLISITMMGTRDIWQVSLVLLPQNLLMLLFGAALVPRLGASGMALALLLSSLALPTWLLPRLMKGTIQRISAPPEQLVRAQSISVTATDR